MVMNNSEFDSRTPSPFHQRGEESRNGTCFADIGGSTNSSTMHSGINSANASRVSSDYQFNAPKLNNSLVSAEVFRSGLDLSRVIAPKRPRVCLEDGNGSFRKWTDSRVVADKQQQREIDDKNECPDVYYGSLRVPDSINQTREEDRGQKALKRLAQNREAARKSRMRKKVYVQQLENSSLRLVELEQELKTARRQSSRISRDVYSATGNRGGSAFDLSYARWSDEHKRRIGDLRLAINSPSTESELRLALGCVMSHYDELFRLKSIGAKSDVLHMLSGMWETPAERCFMWLGGFRCSEILKIIGKEVEPLAEDQLVGMCNLQQSSQQAEDALSQGMEALQQSIVETLSLTLDSRSGLCSSGNVANYMEHMASAMSKLVTLENFLHQADLLRQQTLQRLQRILTTHQAARALLAISDYKSRLRASSLLWLAQTED